jgi:hypothetical protein
MTQEDMSDDPIVAEVRRLREEMFAQYNRDLDALVEDMQRKTENARLNGCTVRSTPEQQSQLRSSPVKRAG